MRSGTSVRTLAGAVVIGAVVTAPLNAIQNAVPGSRAPISVMKISAGPSGEIHDGVFTLTQERSIFSRTTDREVIVFFQWEGTPGPHTLVAHWRSPDGAVSSSSTIHYAAAERRFGAFWPLSLSSFTPLGVWSVEATVDGQPAGRFTFEIREEKVEAPVVRTPLAPAELYDSLNRAFVVIDRIGPRGQSLDAAGGFAVGDGRICTSIVALDAVEALRIVGSNGTARPVQAISVLNRADGWATLTVTGNGISPLGERAAEGPRIGDRLFTIDGSASGGRMLRMGVMRGHVEENEASGGSLLVSLEDPGAPLGAPVVNEFGALVGMLSGPPVAGATRIIDLFRMNAAARGHSVLPISSRCTAESTGPRSLDELQADGQLALPIAGEEHVVSGGFARAITRSPPAPSGQTDAFSIRDEKFVVFVNWHPLERLRGTTQLRAYDAANRLIVQSETKRSNFRKGDFALSFWELPVPRAAGTYRVDVLFESQPVWRGFVRITP